MWRENDPQPLWTLDFGDFAIRATKEYPFYVYDKGWIQAENLEPGDTCRSAADTRITLVAKSFDPTPVPVYNFEVEGGHTYFVGENCERSILVHNICDGSCVDGMYCGNYWHGVKSTLKGIAITGPTRAYFAAGEGVYNAGVKVSSFYNDPKGEAIKTATSAKNTAVALGNVTVDIGKAFIDDPLVTVHQGAVWALGAGDKLLDNNEQIGVIYFNVAADVVFGKVAMGATSKLGKIVDKADDSADAMLSHMRKAMVPHEDTTPDGLLKILKEANATPMSNRIADIPTDRIRIEGADGWKLLKQFAGSKVDVEKSQALYWSERIWLRMDSDNLVSELIHEGTHYFQNTDKTIEERFLKYAKGSEERLKYLKEMRAFREQVKFENAIGATPSFDSPYEIKVHVLEMYFNNRKPKP